MYYLFQAVPLDEGGKVLHFVGKYVSCLNALRRCTSDPQRWWIYQPYSGWDNVAPDHRQSDTAPYPVMPGRVPKEIREQVLG